MAKLRSLKIKSADQFKTLLHSLRNELFEANVHFLIFKEIHKRCQRPPGEITEASFAPGFWQFTLRAHSQTALMQLLRIYDQHKAGFHLLRLLQTVRDNPWLFSKSEIRKRLAGQPSAAELEKNTGSPDADQLENDIQFVSESNLKVKNLTLWRNKVTFHVDPRQVLAPKPFDLGHPLLYADVEELIAEGFKILNRYARYFDGSKFGTNFLHWNDVDFIFKALEHHPVVIEWRKDLKLNN